MTLEDSSQVDLHARLADLAAQSRFVVDAGCGRGAHLSRTAGGAAMSKLLDEGGTAIGIDVALPEGGNPFVTESRLIRNDRWPIESEWADLVFSDWVLEHVARPEPFFDECARVLRPGGRLLARTLQRWSVAGIGARVVPHRFHETMIGVLQPAMNPEDVFPTTLLCNTSRQLVALSERSGLVLTRYTPHQGLGGYGGGRETVESALVGLERRLPRRMWHTVVLEVRKP